MRKSLVIVSLAFQLSMIPWVSAQQPTPPKAKAIKIESIGQLETGTHQLLEAAEAQGWQFLDEIKTPISASNFLPNLKKWIQSENDAVLFHAVSPDHEEIGQFEFSFRFPKTELENQVQLETQEDESQTIRYSLSLRSKMDPRVKTSRTFTIKINQSAAEENALLLKRTLASMENEILFKAQKYLLIKGKKSKNALNTVLNFLIPSANAQVKYENVSEHPLQGLSDFIKSAAQFSFLLGILIAIDVFHLFAENSSRRDIKNILLRLLGASLIITGLNFAHYFLDSKIRSEVKANDPESNEKMEEKNK